MSNSSVSKKPEIEILKVISKQYRAFCGWDRVDRHQSVQATVAAQSSVQHRHTQLPTCQQVGHTACHQQAALVHDTNVWPRSLCTHLQHLLLTIPIKSIQNINKKIYGRMFDTISDPPGWDRDKQMGKVQCIMLPLMGKIT